ncbi:hypothetical protein PanWU01x14_205650 [Parasponia andersonii]|uniref:Uncharacterized protein n=1 Tax=Parasponia andersonii TaxID=3476 RepID=A0A2P5BW88_PARAD|nr:hypothetical protein PanWU01x14_205650 [Parasponia andersonii]
MPVIYGARSGLGPWFKQNGGSSSGSLVFPGIETHPDGGKMYPGICELSLDLIRLNCDLEAHGLALGLAAWP